MIFKNLTLATICGICGIRTHKNAPKNVATLPLIFCQQTVKSFSPITAAITLSSILGPAKAAARSPGGLTWCPEIKVGRLRARQVGFLLNKWLRRARAKKRGWGGRLCVARLVCVCAKSCVEWMPLCAAESVCACVKCKCTADDDVQLTVTAPYRRCCPTSCNSACCSVPGVMTSVLILIDQPWYFFHTSPKHIQSAFDFYAFAKSDFYYIHAELHQLACP